ncbi:MAG: lysophospholipid acyltransferase family protein [Chitinispirillia bacterium]|nr:lysophospholipid acyltransferase family protein [Chitinispirillia bacterium]MCL2242003.1 lysophospholipid acyltransferase family protein [Chitinispirillia bacterium]
MFAISKPKIKFAHYFEYALLRTVEAAVSAAPRGIALIMGAIAGQILCVLGVYKKIVRKNFEHVGIWDRGRMNRIIPKLYKNIGRYAVDVLRRGKLPAYRLHNYEIYTDSRTNGKGTIIVLAHFGNWELLAAIWGEQTDNCLNVVAKPMRNPLVEAWLLKKRTALSVRTILTNNALRGMLSALRNNEITAILIDQHLHGMGTPAPFLGKTASTVRTVAGLARKTGAAAVPVYAMMAADGSYDIMFFKADPPVLDAGENGKALEEAMINAIQAQHNDILSQWIREYPEHWFGWFHRRFKGYVDYK